MSAANSPPSIPQAAADPTLNALIALLASSKEYATFLCSGIMALPYVDTLCDAMPMSSKLVIHLPPCEPEFRRQTQPKVEKDIRLALQIQDLTEFTQDIQQHRLDFILAFVTAETLADHKQLLTLISDTGLALIYGEESDIQTFAQQVQSDHYQYRFQGSDTHQAGVLLSKIDSRHLLSAQERRRGRRRA